jgi:hypothetical protein
MSFVLAFELRRCVMNIYFLKQLSVCKLKHLLFISAAVLFCLPLFFGEPRLGRFRSHELLVGKAARGKGRILLEALAIPGSRFFALWLLVSRVNSPKAWVEAYLAHLQ